MRTGILYDINPQSAFEVVEPSRTAEYERRWAYGGTAFMGASADVLRHPVSNDTAAVLVRRMIARR